MIVDNPIVDTNSQQNIVPFEFLCICKLLFLKADKLSFHIIEIFHIIHSMVLFIWNNFQRKLSGAILIFTLCIYVPLTDMCELVYLKSYETFVYRYTKSTCPCNTVFGGVQQKNYDQIFIFYRWLFLHFTLVQ